MGLLSQQALPTCRTMTQQTAILFPHLIHLSLVGGLGKQELPKIVNLLGRCENLELLTIDVVKTLYLPALVIGTLEFYSLFPINTNKIISLMTSCHCIGLAGRPCKCQSSHSWI